MFKDDFGKTVFKCKCSKTILEKPSLKSIKSNIKAYLLVLSICLMQLSRFHTVTLTTLAPYASTLPQIILVLHTSFLACLASPSLSSLDVQIVVLDFKPLMFHELLHVVMVGVLTLLHGFKGSYFKSTFVELINLVSQESLLLKPYINDMVLNVLQIVKSGDDAILPPHPPPQGHWIEDSKKIGPEIHKKALGFS